MAGSPQWKVYDAEGQYIAACKFVVDAAMIVAGRGQAGVTIRVGHTKGGILWTEGAESFPASESYDGVAEVVKERAGSRWQEIVRRQGGAA